MIYQFRRADLIDELVHKVEFNFLNNNLWKNAPFIIYKTTTNINQF